jgi:hypothetical protein
VLLSCAKARLPARENAKAKNRFFFMGLLLRTGPGTMKRQLL